MSLMIGTAGSENSQEYINSNIYC